MGENLFSFDATKEHLVIVHSIFGEGDPFRLLGCMLDTKLHMHHAIDKILAQMRPKITAILRCRSHYDVKTLVNQYKAHIWNIMEIHNGAIFHAAASSLEKLDRLQKHFLDEIGIHRRDCFSRFQFRLAHLTAEHRHSRLTAQTCSG